MINEITIRKLVDCILLNACSVNSSGLYNGKAGMSLALFEAARFLQDEYIEEQAFDLLQEALISKTDDISFENGLSGIGYVLLYLIKNEFLDAEFNELFSSNHFKIENELRKINNKRNSYRSFSFLTSINYLNLLTEHDAYNESSIQNINWLSEKSSLYLFDNIKKIQHGEFVIPKLEILNLLEQYLKIVNCYHLTPNIELLQLYSDLFIENKFISNFHIGHYLSKIGEGVDNKKIVFAGEENKRRSIKNISYETFTLPQIVRQLYLMRQYKRFYMQEINYLERKFIEETEDETIEQKILKSIHPMSFIAGYKSGVLRFLLYSIFTSKFAEYKNSNYYLLDL
ncbi:MAG: hypothetical protein PHQ11_00910 [Paludibacter sp.]|nr:hypothetical protein [Paludibacter sp.]MDD4198405.1 hypothetical protein [Paludibacter sp.]MDD4427083.1 hypothetical protein [Paludibacter sp.]